MRLDAKISCRDLDNYTIYFLLLLGRDAELYGGKKVFLSDPKEENFSARAFYENVSFDDIKFIFYNIPILDNNGKIYDALLWWDTLSKSEKRNLTDIYVPGVVENSDNSVRHIYRELIFDQFVKNTIKLPEYEEYLNWWKLIPWKNKNKILFENLGKFNYTLDDIKYLYDQHLPNFNDENISILNWWFDLDDDEKIRLIHKYINPYFHITAPDIDEIRMLFDKSN